MDIIRLEGIILREYIELKPNQKLISDLRWLDDLKETCRIDIDLLNRLSRVTSINEVEPHVKGLWDSFLNLAKVLDEHFKGHLSWYITDTELKLSFTTLHRMLNVDYKYIEKELKLSYSSQDNSVNLELKEYRGDEEIKKPVDNSFPAYLTYVAGVWEVDSTRERFNEDDIEKIFEYWLIEKE